MLLYADVCPFDHQMAVDEVARRNIIGSITPMELNMPVLLLLVKRTNLVPATIVQLAKQSTADLKKPLKVSKYLLSKVFACIS